MNQEEPKENPTIVTPVYLKTDRDMPWPKQDKVFYLLASDGLYICRNHEFFSSSVPASQGPAELAPHQKSLRIRYPKVPQALFEQVIGFFDHMAATHGAEAAVLLVWNRESRCVQVLVPEQRNTVSLSWRGYAHPVGLHYEIPTPLANHLALLGDIHSHADEAAYSSWTDRSDETHRPGLHIVVGRLYQEPPEIHVEATVDGHRFRVQSEYVIEGYQRRQKKVSPRWLDKVQVETLSNSRGSGSYRTSGQADWGSQGTSQGVAHGGYPSYDSWGTPAGQGISSAGVPPPLPPPLPPSEGPRDGHSGTLGDNGRSSPPRNEWMSWHGAGSDGVAGTASGSAGEGPAASGLSPSAPPHPPEDPQTDPPKPTEDPA
jgi:PRTRC genetic system protein A